MPLNYGPNYRQVFEKFFNLSLDQASSKLLLQDKPAEPLPSKRLACSCDHRSITSLSRSSNQQHALPISSSPHHCAALGPILSSRSWHYYIHRLSRLHHSRRSRHSLRHAVIGSFCNRRSRRLPNIAALGIYLVFSLC
ncbi:hypothetical protein PCASD_14971 [Puccinia coronata f. sp. avenae]|uniref:Uncharacterized protein n=1 Tax=Puccinia coronata f. sp. avenae TaxID=200324 RepID=A0A2N5U7B9_9BASI|nr:hypothetical protein PCASD_14971 [Puccinia coronata f. sp. avenae]